MLKNAKTEYFNEHEEIATYLAIETLAEKVSDSETAKLARAIRREEERMASFLQGQIKALTGAVVREDIPAALRRGRRLANRKAQKSDRRKSPAGEKSGGEKTRRKTRPKKASAKKRTAQKSRALNANRRRPPAPAAPRQRPRRPGGGRRAGRGRRAGVPALRPTASARRRSVISSSSSPERDWAISAKRLGSLVGADRPGLEPAVGAEDERLAPAERRARGARRSASGQAPSTEPPPSSRGPPAPTWTAGGCPAEARTRSPAVVRRGAAAPASRWRSR